jgi:hypothetical protein
MPFLVTREIVNKGSYVPQFWWDILYDHNTFSMMAATAGITIMFFSCHLNAAVVIIIFCPIDDNQLLLNFQRSHVSGWGIKTLFTDILIKAFISAVASWCVCLASLLGISVLYKDKGSGMTYMLTVKTIYQVMTVLKKKVMLVGWYSYDNVNWGNFLCWLT